MLLLPLLLALLLPAPAVGFLVPTQPHPPSPSRYGQQQQRAFGPPAPLEALTLRVTS
jgi:hypothetical protein